MHCRSFVFFSTNYDSSWFYSPIGAGAITPYPSPSPSASGSSSSSFVLCKVLETYCNIILQLLSVPIFAASPEDRKELFKRYQLKMRELKAPKDAKESLLKPQYLLSKSRYVVP